MANEVQPADDSRVREAFPSVVMALGNGATFIAAYLERLSAVMRDHFDHYEIILVDNGSDDGTADVIAALQKHIPGTALLGLAQRDSDDVATIAGLEHAIGDFVIVLDPRLDQPELIPQLVARAVLGVDIVYALPRDRVEARGTANSLTNRFLRTVAQAKGVRMPEQASSCRLVSRAVLNFMLKPADRHRILMLSPALSGYEFDTVVYDREYPGIAGERVGQGKIGRPSAFGRFTDMLRRAVGLTFAVSVTPLRAVTFFALAVSVMTLLYSVYVVLFWLFNDDVAPGWTSLSLQIAGLFFCTSLVLAVMSEYLLQILESTGRRPLYYLARHSHSEALAYDNQLNVVTRSEEPSTLAAPTETPLPTATPAGQPVSEPVKD